MAAVQAMPVTASIAAYASHPYGGFWIRVLAWIIDAAIVGLVFPVAFLAGSGVHGVGYGVGLFAGWLYEALLLSSAWQATIGKMVLGLRVTDVQGQPIDFGRATVRHFAKYLSTLMLGIGYLMVAFTAKKQGLHDLIAGTLVQKKR